MREIADVVNVHVSRSFSHKKDKKEKKNNRKVKRVTVDVAVVHVSKSSSKEDKKTRQNKVIRERLFAPQCSSCVKVSLLPLVRLSAGTQIS